MKYELLLSLNLPCRNPFFTGREDVLMDLHERLSRANGTTRPQALCGLGGMGKTQAAIEYAYRYRESYRTVLWADAYSRETLSTAMTTIADQLGLPERSEQDQSLAVTAIKRWLQDQPRWLLILDNIEDEMIVRDLMPLSSEGHLLLTSQASAINDLAEVFVLGKMADEEGAMLLLRRAKIIPANATLSQASEEECETAVEIACRMGGLPLALDQAGAYIEETACGLSGYIKRYETQRRLLLNRRGGLLPDDLEASDYPEASDHPASVVTTLSLSVEKAEKVHPLAEDILRLCAFLYHDAIPEEIITKGASAFSHVHPSPTVTSAQVADAVQILCKFSLLNRDPDKSTLSIHPLMQPVLQGEMDEATQRAWAECAVLAVSQTFPAIDFTTWPRCEMYLPHALACVELIKQWQIESSEAAHLLHETAFYLFERASLVRVEGLYQQALTLHRKVLGPRHSDVATDLHRLALLYREQGRYTEAEELFRHALQIREQMLGTENPRTAESFYELGRIHSIQGKYREAEEPYNRALKMRERTLSPNHPDIAASLNELGWLYRHLGRYEDAEEFLSRALAMREKILEPGDPRIAQTLNDLAWLYYDRGKYDAAEALLLRALAIRKQALGPSHPHVAQTLNSLAMLYCVEGRYADSESLYQQARAIREQKLGIEHPYVAQTLDNLALLYYHQKRFDKAESLYKRALAIRRTALRPEHPDITQTINNLGRLYFAQGKYDLAEAFFLEALLTREQALGREHPHVANCLHNLASLYAAQQKYTQAEEMYQRTLAIREQALGREHPQVAQTLNSLAELYAVRGRYDQAQQFYLRALTIYDKTVLSDHPNVAPVLENYANLLRKMGHKSEAAEMDARARAIEDKKE